MRTNQPFSPLRCGLLIHLGVGYILLLFRGRHPWLLIMDVITARAFWSWQRVVLVLTLLVWPVALAGLILVCVRGSRLRAWRLRDLAIVELSLALLAMCGEFASYWLYESLVGLTIHQLATFSAIYATIGRVSQAVAYVVAFLWVAARVGQWIGKRERVARGYSVRRAK